MRKYFLIIFFILMTMSVSGQNLWDYPEPFSISNPAFLSPSITVYAGISIGAQPIWPAIKIGVNGSFLFFEVGAELTFNMFVAAWYGGAWFYGLDLGALSVGMKHAYSYIGVGSAESASYYNSDILYFKMSGVDDKFSLFYLFPGELTIGVTINTYNKGGKMQLPDKGHFTFDFCSSIIRVWNVFDLPLSENNQWFFL